MQQTLVGRESEQAEIATLVQRARGGRPQPLLITGDAGSGKTTLLRHLLDECQRLGFQTLVIESDPIDAGVPYGSLRWSMGAGQPVTDGDSGDATIRERLSGLAAAISPSEPLPFAEQADQVRKATLELLEAWAFHRPVVIACDDLHAADVATAGLLTFLMRHVRHERVFIVATSRAEPELTPGIAADCARFHKDGRLDVMELGPFGDDELGALVEAQLGRPPGPCLLDLLRVRTDGVPFFAVEVLSALAASGGLVETDALVEVMETSAQLVPRRLTTAVLHRVFRIGPDARHVASAAAVIGELDPGRLVVVAALSGLSEARVRAAVDALIEHGVLTSDGERLRFGHAFVRDALYEDVGPALRRHWHDAIARRLDATRSADDDRVVIEIAGHLQRAGGGPEQFAFRGFREAGDLVRDLDPRAAAGWYRHALARLGPDDPAVPDTQLRLSRVLNLGGEYAEAGSIARAAFRAIPAGPARVDAAIVTAHTTAAFGDFARAGEILDAALAEPATRSVVLLLHRAQVHFWAVDLMDARRTLDEARHVGVAGHELTALAIDLQLSHSMGQFTRGAYLRAQLEQQLRQQPPGRQTVARVALAMVTAFNGEPEAAITLCEEAPPGGPMASWFHAVRALAESRRGDLAAAVRHAEIAKGAAGPGDIVLPGYAYALIVGHVERGDLSAARTAEQDLAATTFTPMPSILDCARARLLSVGGEHDAADAVLDRAERRSAEAEHLNVLALVLGQRVDALLMAGDQEGAQAACDRLQALPTDGATVSTTVLRLLAQARLGDPVAAGRAREFAVAHGCLLDAALALAALGVSGGDSSLLVDAYDELGRLGAATRQRAVASDLRRLGRRIPGRRSAATGLSPVERDVASWIAQGLTNREVAGRMSLSSKTVEAHLSRLYRKTGCRTRVELAIAVKDGRLDDNALRVES